MSEMKYLLLSTILLVSCATSEKRSADLTEFSCEKLKTAQKHISAMTDGCFLNNIGKCNEFEGELIKVGCYNHAWKFCNDYSEGMVS